MQVVGTDAGSLVLELAEARPVEPLEEPPTAPELACGRVAALSTTGAVVTQVSFRRQPAEDPPACCAVHQDGRVAVPYYDVDRVAVLEVDLADN